MNLQLSLKPVSEIFFFDCNVSVRSPELLASKNFPANVLRCTHTHTHTHTRKSRRQQRQIKKWPRLGSPTKAVEMRTMMQRCRAPTRRPRRQNLSRRIQRRRLRRVPVSVRRLCSLLTGAPLDELRLHRR
jgi:hypothetical protein